MPRAVIIILIVLAALFAAVGIGGAVYMFNFTFRVPKKRLSEDEVMELRKKQMPRYADLFVSSVRWLHTLEKRPVEITSRDGLKLRADYFPNPENRGTIILMHGYRSLPYVDMSPVCSQFFGMGFSLLLPCHRAHGDSEGKYICFGAKERYDCADWARFVCDEFGADLPIVLDGVSMGAATVLASVSAGLPANVRCIIADCGFTSPYEELAHVMKTMVHLPKFPIFYLSVAAIRLLGGFSVKEFNTEDILRECSVPVLFVHGEDDRLVPPEMSKRAFAACASEKELVTVPGAAHGESYLVDTPGCQKKLAEFIDRYA